MSWVVVIPKEGRGRRACVALLLVWHRLFRFFSWKIFFYLFILPTEGRARPSFVMTPTHAIMDLFAWHRPFYHVIALMIYLFVTDLQTLMNWQELIIHWLFCNPSFYFTLKNMNVTVNPKGGHMRTNFSCWPNILIVIKRTCSIIVKKERVDKFRKVTSDLHW